MSDNAAALGIDSHGRHITSPGSLSLLMSVSVILGICLRLRQYAFPRCLWIDECFLALNVVPRNFAQLTEPLALNQAAPLGFLFAQKLAIATFGVNELAMRFVPLIAGIVALLLFARIARELLKPTAAAIAIALFSFSDTLIYYSNEAKQYELDVVVTILLLLVGIKSSRRSPSVGWLAGAALVGCACVLTSYCTPFLLAAVGIAWLIEDFRKKWLAFVVIGSVWLVTFAVCWYLVFRHVRANDFLNDYWRFGYAPLIPRSVQQLRWYWFAAADLIDPFDQRPVAILAIGSIAVGLLGYARRDRSMMMLLCLPAILALVASHLELYPFSGRLILFLSPIVALLMAKGIELIGGPESPRRQLFYGALILSPTVLASLSSAWHGHHRCEIRPALRHLYKYVQPNDIVYLSWHASILHSYYRLQYGELPDNAIIIYEGQRSPHDSLGNPLATETVQHAYAIDAQTLDWRFRRSSPSLARYRPTEMTVWGDLVATDLDRGVVLETYARKTIARPSPP